jgi:DNA-binding response OmpR family regulator
METTDEQVTILVADDSAVSRKLVEHTLTDKSYSLLFAKNGQEAVERYADHSPSIVIVDWEMPDITGIEFCKHIRTQPLASYTYIILLTGKTEKENTVAGLAAGADDYLTKPFHPEELIARPAPMKVRCSFTTEMGEPFSWDFQLEENDPNRAIDEAILLFFSGLAYRRETSRY